LLLRLLRSQTWPTAADFSAEPHSVAASANDLVSTFVPGWEAADAEMMNEEFAVVRKELVRRRQAPGSYPDAWASRAETQRVLFALVRKTKPALVLETGVADGESTVAILSAMELNGHGELVSVDIAPNVGGLVSDSERVRWRLHILDASRVFQELTDLVAGLPPIDIFFHDSDHSYHHQVTEMRLASHRMAPGGLVICDDSDSSFAFLDFCTSRMLPGRFLFDGKKFLGVVCLGSRVR
jgi:predicted O-methyltransferase YrrM